MILYEKRYFQKTTRAYQRLVKLKDTNKYAEIYCIFLYNNNELSEKEIQYPFTITSKRIKILISKPVGSKTIVRKFKTLMKEIEDNTNGRAIPCSY